MSVEDGIDGKKWRFCKNYFTSFHDWEGSQKYSLLNTDTKDANIICQ